MSKTDQRIPDMAAYEAEAATTRLGPRKQSWLRPAAPYIVYAVLTGSLFSGFLYQVAPDTISYLSIARSYSSGDWSNAINSHWSPLFSWLLAPLLAIGIRSLVALKLLNIITGFVTVFYVTKWTDKIGLGPDIRLAAECSAAIATASFALLQAGPDLLLAGVFLAYLYAAFDTGHEASIRSGVLCGIIGALGYLTKAYFFPFFLAHFFVLLILRTVRAPAPDRLRKLGASAVGLGVFIGLSLPWILTISHREHHPTISVQSDFSFRLRGPDSNGYPQFGRFIPPPAGTTFSMWEAADPGLLPAWHFYDSPAAFRHQIRLVEDSLKMMAILLRSNSVFCIALVVGYFLLAASGRGSPGAPTIPLALALIIYALGYLISIVQDRYFLGWLLLVSLLCYFVVDRICRASTLSAGAGRVLVILVFLSFAALPMASLASGRNGGRSLYDLSRAIFNQRKLSDGNFATCARWNDSLELAYYLNLRFYGTSGIAPTELAGNLSGIVPQSGTTDLKTALSANHIDYYGVWDTCEGIPSDIRRLPDTTNGKVNGIRIYDVRGYTR